MNCPSCGTSVLADDRFCSGCGHEIASRGDERRVVTVLFADIVGFTGFSETRDPEQVKNLVDRCFALLADDISSFGGRVDKVVGDAIIALFGAPIAHEDDAERAVRAALRMQETVENYDTESGVGIRLRIGINTGEVLVGAITAGDEYTAMGDVVNTASRLQTAAQPGTVIVGSDTHSATAEVIHYQSLGMLHARGRETSIETWRAVEPVGRPGERRNGPDTPMLGREPELALLRRSVSSAVRRSRAQLITLTGESGVGKTRLAVEVAEFARYDHDALILTGRCLPYGEANVWGPVAEAIRGVTGIEPSDSDAVARSVVLESVGAALGDDSDESEIVRTTEGLLFLLGHESQFARLERDRAASEGMRAVRVFLDALALRTPIVLWFSDIHWADDAVLHLLDDILERLSRRQMVVLVSARTAVYERWTPKSGLFNALTLGIEPLDDVAASLLVAELLPGVSDDLRSQVVERSAGNPLFIEEMARMLATSGDAVVDSLPANIRSAISARLDGLPDDARSLVEDAAVLGIRGEVEALQRMVEVDRSQVDVEEALRDLERADLVETQGGIWSFRSNLVREVAYGRVTKSDRSRRHAGIAMWLEFHKSSAAATIAFHYRSAVELVSDLGPVDGLPVDLTDRAIDWTIRAARDNSGTSAIERSERLYGAALTLMNSTDPRRAEVLLERASAAVQMARVKPARADLAEASPLLMELDDDRLRAKEALIESELAQWTNDQALALERAEAALRLARDLDEPILVADGLRRRGMVQLFMGRSAESEQSITAALECYEEAEHAAGMAWALQNLAWLSFAAGHMNEAESRLTDSIEAFESLGDGAGQAWSRGLLAYVRIHSGRFAEAEVLAQRTLEEARERGDHWGEAMMNVALATAALWTGRIDEAVERAAHAQAMFPVESDPAGYLQAAAVTGRSLVQAGRVAEGLKLLRESGNGTRSGDPRSEMLGVVLISAAAMAGDLSETQREAGPIRDFDPDIIGESDRVVAVALNRLQLGHPEDAMTLLDLMPDPDSGSGSAWGWAIVALAAAASGRDNEEFVDAVETSPLATYGDRVLARCATACSAARSGDEAGAKVAIKRALDAIPSGGDRLSRVVVAIAETECLRAVDAAELDDAAKRAEDMASAIGVGLVGWGTAFAMACGQEAVPSVSS